MDYREIIEDVASYLNQSVLFRDELVEAKEFYFEQTGRVFDQDEFYELRMTNFVEWFVADRPLVPVGITPARLYLETFEKKLSEAQRKILRNLIESVHSLFAVRRVLSQKLLVVDLFSREKFTIALSSDWFSGRDGDVFEGRVVAEGEAFGLADTFCLHPTQVSAKISEESKVLAGSEEQDVQAFIFKLASFRLRFDQYRSKIDPKDVYRL